MSGTFELATAWVRIVPSVEGIQEATTRAMRPAADAAKNAGRETSKSFADSFVAGLDRAAPALKDAGKKATLAVSLPLAGLGVLAFNASRDFNAGMANVGTLIPGNVARVGELKTAVQEMAIEVGASTADLADGLYQTVSAFGDTSDTALILEINARAAAAGLATTTDSINLTSAVTKIYGDTSAEAVSKAADLALMTVRLGQTTFPELASSMGRVTPIAQALGQSQEELYATFATLTGVTGSAAEVATQYRGVLAALSNPSAELTRLVQERGYATAQAALEDLGLVETMKLIVAETEATGQPLANFIGNVEAQPAVLALAGAQADSYTEKLAAMSSAAGTTDQAFLEVSEGTNAAGFAWEQAQAKAEVLLQKIGDGLGPALLDLFDAAEPVVQIISDMATQFAEADPETQKVIIGIAAVAAAIGPAMWAMGSLASTTSTAITTIRGLAPVLAAGKLQLSLFAQGYQSAQVAGSAFSGIAGTMGGSLRSVIDVIAKSRVATVIATAAQWAWNAALTANPIGIIITLIAALVAGLIWFFTQTELGQEIWENVMAAIGAAATWLWETVLKPVFDFIGAIFTWLYENIIQPVVSGILLYVGIWAAIFTWLWETILAPVFGFIGQIFTWIWETIILPIVGYIVAYVQMWGAIFTWLWEYVISPIFAMIGEVFGWIWGNIIQPIIDHIVTGIEVWGAIFAWLWEYAISPAIDAIGAAFTWVWENVISPVVDFISAAIEAVGQTIRDIFGGISDFIGAAFAAVVGVVKSPLNALIDLINGVIAGLNSIQITIPDWVPEWGGMTFGVNLPKIPKLAMGGIVMPRAGGVPAILAEAGRPEVVLPLDRLGEFGVGSERKEMHLHYHAADGEESDDWPDELREGSERLKVMVPTW